MSHEQHRNVTVWTEKKEEQKRRQCRYSHSALGYNFQLKWFEPRIDLPAAVSGNELIVRLSVFRKTVVCDWKLDDLVGSQLQSQVKVAAVEVIRMCSHLWAEWSPIFLHQTVRRFWYFIGECNPVTCFDHLASRTGICDASAEILGDGSPLWHSVRPAEPLLGLISTNVVPWFWSHSLRSFICTTLSKLFLKYVFQKAVICLRTTRENCIADHGQSLNEHSYLSSRGGNLIVLSLPFLSKKPNGMLPYFTEYQCLLRSLDSVRFWVKFRPTYLQLIHSLIHS